jgi:glucose-6-phosphate isomerase
MTLSATPAWKALAAHYAETSSATMKDMFAADPGRFEKFSLDFEGILMDFSKNRITEETMKLLYELAIQQDVSGLAKKMFSGEKISKYR